MLLLFIFFVLLLILKDIRLAKEDDFMSKDRCNSIKGIFILLIIFSHALQYVDNAGYSYYGLEAFIPVYRAWMGQFVVVIFLFYSGYGVAIQILRKGEAYINSMPKRRLLTTLLNFDVAVICFIILNIILSIPMSSRQIVLSLLAWDSVGNSNWYIFVIIICYLVTYILTKNLVRQIMCGVGILITLIIFMVVLSFLKDSHWYSTILSYPAGYLFALCYSSITSYFKTHYYKILCILLLFLVVTKYYCPSVYGLFFNFRSIAFAMIIVLITMRIQIDNKWLRWFGINLFPIYIYQRIPMITLQNLFGDVFIFHHSLLFLCISFIVTCIIAKFYDCWRFKL